MVRLVVIVVVDNSNNLKDGYNKRWKVVVVGR